MASSNTRLEIVELAVAQAGRGTELYDHAKKLLNVLLKSWAIRRKWPQLRTIGSQITLAAGARTVSLPADFGWGMDSLLIVDTTNTPLTEVDVDEFVDGDGIATTSTTGGQPSFYMIDKAAGVIRFNCLADQAYTLQPIYFKVPTAHPMTSAGDDEYPWYDDDKGLIEGLVELIYQYTQDDREIVQKSKVESDVNEFRRGTSGMSGGSSTIPLSTTWFKKRGR